MTWPDGYNIRDLLAEDKRTPLYRHKKKSTFIRQISLGGK
ncbi:hypothetical protein ALP22_200284 [Pseudomonas coronafaciens pv. porri]|nr:hypothetical protein ALP22_200284 [Pseudomonas coronafaciens pv. porri]